MPSAVLRSSLTPQVCLERIAAAIDSDDLMRELDSPGSRPVLGHVGERVFQLQLRAGMFDVFPTVLQGRVREDQAGTTIETRSYTRGVWFAVFALIIFEIPLLFVWLLLLANTSQRVVDWLVFPLALALPMCIARTSGNKTERQGGELFAFLSALVRGEEG